MKYEITDIKHPNDPSLKRIRALKDIPEFSIKKGHLGGYVQGEHNLSQEGTCWIFNNARVIQNAIVSANAGVYDSARISGDACISDNAQVFGNAQVSGYTNVSGSAQVTENGYADVVENKCVIEKEQVDENTVYLYGGIVYSSIEELFSRKRKEHNVVKLTEVFVAKIQHKIDVTRKFSETYEIAKRK